jgi:hypothetical protein
VTERCPDLAEPFHGQSAPVRELVVSVPPPRCGHRKSEDSAFAQQILIGNRRRPLAQVAEVWHTAKSTQLNAENP